MEEKWITSPYMCMLLSSLEGIQQSLTSYEPCKINNFIETIQANLIRIVHWHLKKPGAKGRHGL